MGMLVLAAAAEASGAVTGLPKVKVRIYDAGNLPRETLQEALAVAGRIMASAAIAPEWITCEAGTEVRSAPPAAGPRVPEPAATCATVRAPGELTIRLVRVAVPAGYRGTLPLGDALVDTAGRAAVLATIYIDRVRWLADAAHVDAATLLGRAIAHELGHLLTASTSHSRRGVMRPRWTRDDVRSAREEDWVMRF